MLAGTLSSARTLPLHCPRRGLLWILCKLSRNIADNLTGDTWEVLWHWSWGGVDVVHIQQQSDKWWWGYNLGGHHPRPLCCCSCWCCCWGRSVVAAVAERWELVSAAPRPASQPPPDQHWCYLSAPTNTRTQQHTSNNTNAHYTYVESSPAVCVVCWGAFQQCTSPALSIKDEKGSWFY